jgi:hypothetical protein
MHSSKPNIAGNLSFSVKISAHRRIEAVGLHKEPEFELMNDLVFGGKMSMERLSCKSNMIIR